MEVSGTLSGYAIAMEFGTAAKLWVSVMSANTFASSAR